MKIFRSLVLDEIEKFAREFDSIEERRQKELIAIGEYIAESVDRGKTAKLIFICTHNSRRSHIAQIWASAASAYYNVSDIEFYSGGTEETTFNPKAIEALRRSGFRIEKKDDSKNPVYSVYYLDSATENDVKCLSKKYDSNYNPRKDFIAVMTCSHADENCPLVHGAEKRFSLHYIDPKEFEDTDVEKRKYDEICKQIGKEIFFLFSIVKNNLSY